MIEGRVISVQTVSASHELLGESVSVSCRLGRMAVAPAALDQDDKSTEPQSLPGRWRGCTVGASPSRGRTVSAELERLRSCRTAWMPVFREPGKCMGARRWTAWWASRSIRTGFSG